MALYMCLGQEIQSQLTYGSNLLFTLCQAKWPHRLEAKKHCAVCSIHLPAYTEVNGSSSFCFGRMAVSCTCGGCKGNSTSPVWCSQSRVASSCNCSVVEGGSRRVCLTLIHMQKLPGCIFREDGPLQWLLWVEDSFVVQHSHTSSGLASGHIQILILVRD